MFVPVLQILKNPAIFWSPTTMPSSLVPVTAVMFYFIPQGALPEFGGFYDQRHVAFPSHHLSKKKKTNKKYPPSLLCLIKPTTSYLWHSCPAYIALQLRAASKEKGFCSRCWSFSSVPDRSKLHWSQFPLGFPVGPARRLDPTLEEEDHAAPQTAG